MKSSQATITATAAAIVDGSAGNNGYPLSATVKNSGATTMYVGGSDVTNSNGFAVGAGEAVSVDLVNDILYAVTASGTTTVQILRVGL